MNEGSRASHASLCWPVHARRRVSGRLRVIGHFRGRSTCRGCRSSGAPFVPPAAHLRVHHAATTSIWICSRRLRGRPLVPLPLDPKPPQGRCHLSRHALAARCPLHGATKWPRQNADVRVAHCQVAELVQERLHQSGHLPCPLFRCLPDGDGHLNRAAERSKQCPCFCFCPGSHDSKEGCVQPMAVDQGERRVPVAFA